MIERTSFKAFFNYTKNYNDSTSHFEDRLNRYLLHCYHLIERNHLPAVCLFEKVCVSDKLLSSRCHSMHIMSLPADSAKQNNTSSKPCY